MNFYYDIINKLLLEVANGGKITNGLSVVYLSQDKQKLVIEHIGDNPSTTIPYNVDTLADWLESEVWRIYK